MIILSVRRRVRICGSRRPEIQDAVMAADGSPRKAGCPTNSERQVGGKRFKVRNWDVTAAICCCRCPKSASRRRRTGCNRQETGQWNPAGYKFCKIDRFQRKSAGKTVETRRFFCDRRQKTDVKSFGYIKIPYRKRPRISKSLKRWR